jgi:hypothetical protein
MVEWMEKVSDEQYQASRYATTFKDKSSSSRARATGWGRYAFAMLGVFSTPIKS